MRGCDQLQVCKSWASLAARSSAYAEAFHLPQPLLLRRPLSLSLPPALLPPARAACVAPGWTNPCGIWLHLMVGWVPPQNSQAGLGESNIS